MGKVITIEGLLYTESRMLFLTEVDDARSWHKLNSSHVRARVSRCAFNPHFRLHLLKLADVKNLDGKSFGNLVVTHCGDDPASHTRITVDSVQPRARRIAVKLKAAKLLLSNPKKISRREILNDNTVPI